MRSTFAVVAVVLAATAAADQSTGAPTPKRDPAWQPVRCIEQLAAACDEGLAKVRQIISPAGIQISIQSYYSDGAQPVVDERRLRPADLTDERVVCQIFDGKGTSRYSTRCAQGKQAALVQCSVENGLDRFTVSFRADGKRARLVELRGHVEN